MYLYTLLPFSTRRRVLEPSCPQEPYRRRKNEEKTVVNWPDRSLFLAELEFLMRFDKATTEALVIVYAGALVRWYTACARVCFGVFAALQMIFLACLWNGL